MQRFKELFYLHYLNRLTYNAPTSENEVTVTEAPWSHKLCVQGTATNYADKQLYFATKPLLKQCVYI